MVSKPILVFSLSLDQAEQFHFLFGLELILILAQTGNGTMKMYTNLKLVC